MGSVSAEKPHAVLVPYPAQGHITPMLQLAKLLYSKGFHITFVNTEYNHKRLVRARGEDLINGIDGFNFETIPDGLPPSDIDATQDIPSLCDSTPKHCLVPFRELLKKLNRSELKVTCIVSDGVMSFTLDAAKEIGVPEVLFWTTSACGFWAYVHYKDIIGRGIVPLPDESGFTPEFLDTPIDFIPGMNKMRLRDMPSFVRTTNLNDIMPKFILRETSRATRASAIVLNTFDELEKPVLDAMANSALPPVYTVGPLFKRVSQQLPMNSPVASLTSSLWKEDSTCIDWLQTKEPGSVVYVNFGSITVMTNEQMIEFAWGLARSKRDFLWVIRPDLVRGDNAMLPEEFLTETKGRGLLTSWCNQEKALSHASVGGFLTHCGWNSTLESVCCGVPMICWPFFAEQQTNCRYVCEEWKVGMEIDSNVKREENCRYVCEEWKVGMEIDSNVKREEVEDLILELIGGENGKLMRRRVLELKGSAMNAIAKGGPSVENLDKMVKNVLLANKI